MLRLTVLACFLVASTTAATTCAAPPVILGDAITVQASSASGTASLVIPVASLTVLGDTADFRFPQPPASHILLIADGGTAEIAILSGLNVEFTGESSIRLGFDAYAGSSATQFTITSGKLSRTQTPAAFAGANASVVFHDVNLNGGSFNGSYVFPSPPIMVEYAYGAFYNDNSPLAPSVGFLLAPLYLNFNHVALGEGRFPASGDLVPFDQPVNQFHAAFSFTLSAFDSARANSLYTITPSQRCGHADIASIGGLLIPDTRISPDDLIAYLSAFFAGDLVVADLAQIGGATTPDGELTSDDLIAFLVAFFGGCQGV